MRAKHRPRMIPANLILNIRQSIMTRSKILSATLTRLRPGSGDGHSKEAQRVHTSTVVYASANGGACVRVARRKSQQA